MRHLPRKLSRPTAALEMKEEPAMLRISNTILYDMLDQHSFDVTDRPGKNSLRP